MIFVIAMMLLVISFEIILIRVDMRIDMIMKDLGIDEESWLKYYKNKILHKKEDK